MQTKPEITIYGYGYVGKAVTNFLKDHYQLQVIDPLLDQANGDIGIANGCVDRKSALPTKYGVICVPTKMNDDGTCDTSIVEEILKDSDHEFYLIKSTIIPGTTEHLIAETGKMIAFSPEYIGEGNYEIPFWENLPHPTNMKLHSFHIFGGAREVTKEFVNLWQKVAGWSASYHQTDTTTAELVKYAENAYLATKKIFCDQLYEIARVFGVDYNELKELWLLDGRIGRSMTLIFPDKRGFGGKCLPKDVTAIMLASMAKGYNPDLLGHVLGSNEIFNSMNPKQESDTTMADDEKKDETAQTEQGAQGQTEAGTTETEAKPDAGAEVTTDASANADQGSEAGATS